MATFTGTNLSNTADAALGVLNGFTGGTVPELQDLIGDNFLALDGIDTITAGAGNDTIDGGAGEDTLNGGDGDDIIFGGTGNDHISGGLNTNNNSDPDIFGDDILIYSAYYNPYIPTLTLNAGDAASYATGIVVTFSAAGSGTVAGVAGNDDFTGIEQVWGTKNADVFFGAAGVTNAFAGMAGNDTFNGGGLDAVVYTGEILDSALFTSIDIGPGQPGVIVNMSTATRFGQAAGTATDLFGNTDEMTGIAALYGTFNDDILVGSSASNILVGAEGYDIVVGGAGNDTIDFGGFNSFGSAFDIADYRFDGGAGAISVSVAPNGTATVTDTFGNTDTIFSFGTIGGTDLGDSFTGSANTDRFAPGRGADAISSGGGGLIYGGDEIVYWVDSAAMSGIDYDANRVGAQLLSAYFGNDTFTGFTSIWLEATNLADSLKGGTGDNVFFALGGVDTIDGRGNTVDGGDVLAYADRPTNDTGNGVTFNASNTTAGSGTVIDAGGATDTYLNIERLAGSMNADTFNGSVFNDFFEGHGGNDTIIGSDGVDTVLYLFDEVLAGGLEISLLELSATPGIVHGITANLATGEIIGLFEDQNTAGFEDRDTVSGIEKVLGTSFSDSIIGDGQANTLMGFGGNDTLNGGAGIDFLYGGTENDTYYVDNFDDEVFELNGQGFDVLYASSSYTLGSEAIEELRAANQSSTLAINLSGNGYAQLISANNGNNTLNGNGGIDQMYGRNGNDIYIVDVAGDQVFETSGQGTDSVFAKASYTLAANQSIETLATTAQSGTTAINLTGNNLAQTVNGNNGANVINGGGGTDSLFGRQGNDIFVFNTALGAGNIDTIGDYNVAADTIRLSQAIFTGIGATLDAGEFVIGAAALDADDRIIYNSATGALIFDSNGSTAGGAQQFATLSTGLAMTAAEFQMIA